ncbi:hypothetical protein B0T18DRAFT_26471 [Schizothecium vesticola]|uniref:Uncharacterized protein n=1 Tax=Schizothecium vesticola TaxID=314040 RepID=A0AA40FA06_9PEZI|nr:hypothetical protein B0T18DRAFT_26471 [Schizothecium vesticola]
MLRLHAVGFPDIFRICPGPRPVPHWALLVAPLCRAPGIHHGAATGRRGRFAAHLDHRHQHQERRTALRPRHPGSSQNTDLSQTSFRRATYSSRVPARAKTRNGVVSTASHFEHYQESICVSRITMAPLQHQARCARHPHGSKLQARPSATWR